MRIPKPWEKKWKKFLYEDITDVSISFKEANKLFNMFHLSDKFLGEPFFTFTPRVPRSPARDYEFNVIEDDFTPRISVSDDIEWAIMALEARNPTGLHVYVRDYYKDGETPAMELDVDDCPETPGMEYGEDFIMRKWLIYQWNKGKVPGEFAKEKDLITPKARIKDPLAPSNLPNDLGQEFEGCVPDGFDNQEYWLTEPTSMLYLGTTSKGRQINLSSAGLTFLKEKGEL